MNLYNLLEDYFVDNEDALSTLVKSGLLETDIYHGRLRID